MGGGWQGLLDAHRHVIFLPGDVLFRGEKWKSILLTGPFFRERCRDVGQVSKRTHGAPLTWADVAFLICQSADKKRANFPQPKIRQSLPPPLTLWTVSAAVLMVNVLDSGLTPFTLNVIFQIFAKFVLLL